jgi:hypothetical protein
VGITVYDNVKNPSVTTSYQVRQLFFLSDYAELIDADKNYILTFKIEASAAR